MILNEEFLTEAEVARMLGISVKTMRNRAARRLGPPKIKAGHTIMYRKEAVADWLKSCEVPMAAMPRRSQPKHAESR